MKKILLFIGLFLLTTNIFSQVMRLRANSIKTATFNEQEGKYIWGEVVKSKILVVVSEYKFTIYSAQTLSLSKVAQDTVKIIDDNECTEFLCVDGDGIQCSVNFCIDKAYNYSVYVKYADYIFSYYCTKEDD